ncbi:MAG: M20/M25/M40 family metallo-hydrolase [Proteobacteria bacterium]|nr:M20/M25/M40 family metallo-hydrolase [Pseudomonadota bacterium]
MLENALGVGRIVGEAVGRAVQHFKGSAPSAPTTPSAPAKPHGEPGVITKAFLELNHIIAEPITPFLVDGATLTNRLFAERPVQTMAFRDRPSPGVDRNRLVESFVNLRGISGTSDHEGEVSAEIGRQLDALGIAYARKPDHTIIATIPGTVKDAPTVVLSAHLDTVGPTSPDGVRRDSRVIHTNEREVLGGDDRAGCAEILEAVRRIIETGADHPEIKLVFDVCEEGGLKGATRLVADEITQRPALGYVVDALAPEDINLTNDAVFVNPRSVKYTFSQEAPVVQVAMRGMADAGSRARPMHVPIMAGAGSDANAPAFNNARIQTIAIGAGERDIHGPLENVRIDDLEQAARNVVGIIQAACDLRVDGDTIVPRA